MCHCVCFRHLNCNEGSLVKGEEGSKGICGLAIQRDLDIIEVDDEHSMPSVTKQCQMLGIDIWNVIEDDRTNRYHDKTRCMCQVGSGVSATKSVIVK